MRRKTLARRVRPLGQQQIAYVALTKRVTRVSLLEREAHLEQLSPIH